MSACDVLFLVIGVIFAYLLGSIPTAVWVGKIFFGKDVRDYGSGNAGATNSVRVLGWKAGIFVLAFDVLKGSLAVLLSDCFVHDNFSGTQIINYNVFCACVAVIGHVYPIFAGFKGGKGVATLAGIMLALLPWQTGTACVIFIVVLLFSGYVSLSSIVTALCFPFVVFFLPEIFTSLPPAEISEIIFAVVIAFFIPITHLRNIKRLLQGEEKRIFNNKRKKERSGK